MHVTGPDGVRQVTVWPEIVQLGGGGRLKIWLVKLTFPSVMKKSSGGKPGGGGKVLGAIVQDVPWIDMCNRKPVFAPLLALKK